MTRKPGDLPVTVVSSRGRGVSRADEVFPRIATAMGDVHANPAGRGAQVLTAQCRGWMMLRFAVMAMMLGLMGGMAAVASLRPQTNAAARSMRVVSINPCADGILEQVAGADQIAAISHYSQDPRASSVSAAWAARFAVTQGSAEEVLALRPDAVLAGAHVALPTMQMLKRLGIRVVQLPVAASVEESIGQIRQVSHLLGQEARGEALIRRIGNALDNARPGGGQPVPAILWQTGGMVPGAGTLGDELLTRTGFRNASADYGLRNWDILPLEALLAKPPALVLTSIASADRGDRLLRHPVLAKLGRRIAIREFPPKLLHCAGPTLIPAAQRLARLRAEMRP